MSTASASSKLVGGVITRAVVPVLKPLGFRRSGSTFRREWQQCIQVVNVQSSQWNHRDEARFTINLGVYLPAVLHEVSDYLDWKIGRSGPQESQCQLRRRIGRLLPTGLDTWWSLHPGSPMEPVVTEVEAALRGPAMRWLEQCGSPETALTGLMADKSPLSEMFALGAALAVRDSDLARRLARGLAESRRQNPEVLAWLTQRGLIEP